MTQHEKILRYIQIHGSITTYEAFLNLGITKLTTRISELRKAGFTFISEKCKSENGEYYFRYKLPAKG